MKADWDFCKRCLLLENRKRIRTKEDEIEDMDKEGFHNGYFTSKR